MGQLLEERRENWGSRSGFVLAAIGSAVGLGNLWAFPYKLYSYGGGAFLIPYILAIVLVGIPILILEFSLGHYTQLAAPNALARCNKRLEFIGWWGIILSFIIITYYPVILAYCFSYLWYSICGIFNGGNLPWAGQGIEGISNAKHFFMNDYVGYEPDSIFGSIKWHIVLPLLLSWLAMYLSIFKGVKLVSKIVWLTVPLPWMMLLILTIRGLTLDGSTSGLAYYLEPDWTQLAKPSTWRFAFGQAFFSMSLAFGVMITYASFLHRKSDINNNAVIIGLSDFGTSFIAGLAIFATLGGMTHATKLAGNHVPITEVAQKGASLAFIAFPFALSQLPYSAWFSFIFFFALITLGIDSAFSITESILTSIIDKTGWRRSVVLPVMSVIGAALGLIFVTSGGLNWLEVIDGFINGTWGIALLGLLECIVLGWFFDVDILRAHANSKSDWKLGRWWNFLIKIIIPIILGTLFIWSLRDDLEGNYGIYNNGKIFWPSCVGFGIILLSPLVAILISLKKNVISESLQGELFNKNTVKRKLNSCLFAISLIIFVSISFVLFKTNLTQAENILSGLALFSFIAILLITNHFQSKDETDSTNSCSFSRFAGILSIFGICLTLSTYLINLVQNDQTIQARAAIPSSLDKTAYIILATVFLIMIFGLGWCFYRAVTAQSQVLEEQHPDEING